jgi:hypothetical protein
VVAFRRRNCVITLQLLFKSKPVDPHSFSRITCPPESLCVLYLIGKCTKFLQTLNLGGSQRQQQLVNIRKFKKKIITKCRQCERSTNCERSEWICLLVSCKVVL